MKKLISAILLCTAVFAFAQNGATLRYAYEIGKMYNYALTTQTTMAQEMGGHEMVTEMGQDAKLVIAPQAVAENGDYACWISFTEMSMKIKNFRMDTTMVMTDLLNKRAEIVHTPLGKVKTAAMIDTISQGGGPMMSQMGIEPAALFKRLMTSLPENEVVVGGAWTETKTDTIVQGGITIAIAPNTTYSALAEEEKSGFKCIKIAFTGTMAVSGSGTQMGANIVVDGEGTQEGTFFFAPAEGLLVSAESSSNQEQTIAITGPANMTIPQTVTVKSSYSYLP